MPLRNTLCPISQIDHIILFEELMLRRVDELLKEGDIRTAYELLLRVEKEIPAWELSKPRFENLLLVESGLRAGDGDIYAALALLDELANRNINNPELRPRFGEIVAPMIETAVADEDFRKARYLISRIERVFPGHETAVDMAESIAENGGAVFCPMRSSRPVSENLLLRLIWHGRQKRSGHHPAIPGRSSHRRWRDIRCCVLRSMIQSHQRLSFLRHANLTNGSRELIEVPLFEPTSADELTYFRSSFFEVWDPTDLGREVVFTLRETRPTWQSQPILTANQIADALGRRMAPDSPLFNSRLASFVREVSVRSPSEMKIRFSRVPLSIESLLRFPIIAAASHRGFGRP